MNLAIHNSAEHSKRAIIVGASSGIGRALSFELKAHGYQLGLMARRQALLEDLHRQLEGPALIKVCDVSQTTVAMESLRQLISELGGLDLIVISAGIGHLNPELSWDLECETIEVNALAFAALANVAFTHFIRQGHGHLVGISSIAALAGSEISPAYNATKAFASNYLSGLRKKAAKVALPIVVTDILPGFVDTAMAKGPGQFWVAPAGKAARQIMKAIQRRASRAYITRRWRLLAWVLKSLPEPIQRRI